MSAGAVPTPECIQEKIGALGDWFQNLDLRGIPTAPHHPLGDYPAAKWRQISPALPDNMAGLSVLDIGCNAGFHSLECKRRGASYVLGVDADPHYLAQARFAAEVLEMEIEWRQMSVYSILQIERQFDYVLFMGLFYHLRYPLYALDMIVKLVGRRLVFQTMLRGEEMEQEAGQDYSFWDPGPFRRAGFPRMTFIEHRFAGDPTNWWIPNRAAAEAMLRTSGLEIVSHPEAETWICSVRPEGREPGFVWDRELEGTL